MRGGQPGSDEGGGRGGLSLSFLGGGGAGGGGALGGGGGTGVGVRSCGMTAVDCAWCSFPRKASADGWYLFFWGKAFRGNEHHTYF